MADRKYNNAESGVDSICLPEDHVWGHYPDGDRANTNYPAYVFGTEIHTNLDAGVFPYTVHTLDMSCAVCKTNISASVMIPTRDVYYPDWTEEYHGYLMAGTSGDQGSNHICMHDES